MAIRVTCLASSATGNVSSVLDLLGQTVILVFGQSLCIVYKPRMHCVCIYDKPLVEPRFMFCLHILTLRQSFCLLFEGCWGGGGSSPSGMGPRAVRLGVRKTQ